MATHKSALKRAKQSRARRLRNLSHKTRAKRAVKQVRLAVAEGNGNRAQELLPKATSVLQKTASKGAIHRNKASRIISRLARQANKVAQEKAA